MSKGIPALIVVGLVVGAVAAILVLKRRGADAEE
jgi:hypothetical protein